MGDPLPIPCHLSLTPLCSSKTQFENSWTPGCWGECKEKGMGGVNTAKPQQM